METNLLSAQWKRSTDKKNGQRKFRQETNLWRSLAERNWLQSFEVRVNLCCWDWIWMFDACMWETLKKYVCVCCQFETSHFVVKKFEKKKKPTRNQNNRSQLFPRRERKQSKTRVVLNCCALHACLRSVESWRCGGLPRTQNFYFLSHLLTSASARLCFPIATKLHVEGCMISGERWCAVPTDLQVYWCEKYQCFPKGLKSGWRNLSWKDHL